MYSDTLTRIQNGLKAGKASVKAPFTKFDFAILEALLKAGYIKNIERKGRGYRRAVEIILKYDESKTPVIDEIKIISKPSRRMYVNYEKIKTSKQGYGKYFLSTNKGILTGEEARREKVGGELLFEIW